MAESDTAEYWFDVKRVRMPYMGRTFTHIPNSQCGHLNRSSQNRDTSEYLNDVNCFACLKLIEENGNIYGLKEGVSRRQQSAIDKEKHKFRFGKCECGCAMTQRTNKKTGELFLGCSNFPRCTKTKNYRSYHE